MRLPARLKRSAAASIVPLLFLLFLSSSNDAFVPPAPSEYAQDNPIDATVVIPSFKEQPNIRPLVERIFHSVTTPSKTEVVVVDDNSQDGTVEDVSALASEGYNVKLILRTTESGLSSAVLRGMAEASGQKLVVMDADLQHPPESVQAFFDALTEETPFALGTRYAAGVEMDKSWPMYRKIISWGARMLARPLTSASDPMTGFFGVTRDIVRIFSSKHLEIVCLTCCLFTLQFTSCSPLNPTGFKIALELLLKSHPQPNTRIAEVPYNFSKRQVGSSKLSSKVMLKYVVQLLSLYRWRFPIRSFVVAEIALVTGFWVLFTIGARAHQGYAERNQDRLTRRKGKYAV